MSEKPQQKIILGTQYGTKVQKRAIEYADSKERQRQRQKRENLERDIAAIGIENLMMPEFMNPLPPEVLDTQAMQAAQGDLVDLQPPTEYGALRRE